MQYPRNLKSSNQKLIIPFPRLLVCNFSQLMTRQCHKKKQTAKSIKKKKETGKKEIIIYIFRILILKKI